MKKLLYIASIMLLGAVACTRENEFIERPVAENKGKVAVTMGLRLPVELTAETRATDKDYRDHLPKIDAIRVAVFGTSSYPQAYELAYPVEKKVVDGKTVYTEDGASYAQLNDSLYYFKVYLPVYEGEAIVHIVANGDESIDFLNGTENSIMSTMETTDNVGGYWARVVLPDGILAQTDQYGIMKVEDGYFVPSDETARLFEDLVLVRNFAEIKLSVAANAGISDVSWALVNDPVSGSIAPMVGTNFLADYKDYIYDAKQGKMVLAEMTTDPETGKPVPVTDEDGNIANIYATYHGYMVNNALNMLPTGEGADLNWKRVDQSVFSYERVDPNKTNPTYIMLKCHFGSDTGNNWSYYRVDLMDENVGGYFPLYRNYMYQIKIDLVGNRGASTFQEAANRNSGGNVSMSAETKTLTDVSDGFSRMFVKYVEKTFTSGGLKDDLWVYYIPNVSTGTVNNSSIEVSVKEMGTALASAVINTVTVTGASVGLLDVAEVKKVSFTLNEQSADKDLVSVIQIKATNGGSGAQKSTIYRDITLKVMKKMDMDLALEPDTLPEGTNKNTVLHIELADTLQSSMFPLVFFIEDLNRTLNPTGKDGAGKSIDVPVKVGTCLYDETNKNSYAFIRTVNWSEYEPMRDAWVAAKEAGTSTDGIIDFTTQFKTVESNSATTIYVDNEYFNMQSIDLACARFSVSTTTAEVGYQAGTAFVTVSTNDDVAWTATVDNGGGLTRADGTTTITGTGTETFKVNYDANTTAQPKVYTVTVTAEGLPTATTTITQRRAPAPSPFSPSDFSGSTANSEDGYLSLSYGNGFSLSGGYLYGGGNNNRTITFTPKNGVTITKIVISYYDQYNYMDTRPRFNPTGTVTSGGASVTWTGSSANAVTYTMGDSRKYITQISVEYR